MSCNIRGSAAVQNRERFFVLPCRVPADTLSQLQSDRSAAHPASLWRTFQQGAISPCASHSERQWFAFCIIFRCRNVISHEQCRHEEATPFHNFSQVLFSP